MHVDTYVDRRLGLYVVSHLWTICFIAASCSKLSIQAFLFCCCVQVFTLTAADAATTLAWARDGIETEDQLGASRRKLLQTPKLHRKLQRVLHANASAAATQEADHIEHGTLNGWLGVLTTGTIADSNPEVQRYLETRNSPMDSFNPFPADFDRHMSRGPTSAQVTEWKAIEILRGLQTP